MIIVWQSNGINPAFYSLIDREEIFKGDL